MASFFIFIIDLFRKYYGLFDNLSNKGFWLGSFAFTIFLFIKLLNSAKMEVTELKRRFIVQLEGEMLLLFIPLWLYVYNGEKFIYSIEPIILILYCFIFIPLLIKLYFDYKEVMLEEIIVNIDSVEYVELKEEVIILLSKTEENEMGRINTTEIPWYFGRMIKYEIIEVKDTVDVKKLYLYESIDYKVNKKIVEVLSSQK